VVIPPHGTFGEAHHAPHFFIPAASGAGWIKHAKHATFAQPNLFGDEP
jgi:hypothetical protein